MSPEAARFPPASFACPTLALREKAHLAAGSEINLANFAFAVELKSLRLRITRRG